MLERSEFSLARAGVMVGIASLLFLGSGLFFNTVIREKEVSDTHFDEQSWQRVSRVLHHLAPADDAATSASTGRSTRCTDTDPDYPALRQTIQELHGVLDTLVTQKFLTKTYRLSWPGLKEDEAFHSLRCADIQTAVRWLLPKPQQASTSFLESLTWKERLSPTVQNRLASEAWVIMPRQLWTTRSPWSGLPGCVYWSDAQTGQLIYVQGPQAGAQKFCEERASAATSALPPAPKAPVLAGLPNIMAALAPWRSPQHDLYERLVGDTNKIVQRGHEQLVGLHTQLSFDPHWQTVTQDIAQCYTGNPGAQCAALDPRGKDRYEGARVRMAGVAVVDIPSGRLIAAASANSPCYWHDRTRMGARPADCPPLPENNIHRPKTPQPIVNHALFTQAPPGSLVKPLLMAGIVQKANADASLAGLELALQKSDSQRFLDAFLCRQKLGSGNFMPNCDRPAQVLQSAHLLGWNTGCDVNSAWAQGQCGMVDLLFGAPLASVPSSVDPKYVQASLYRPIQLPTLMGQFMVTPTPLTGTSPGHMDMNPTAVLPTPDQRLACAKSGKTGYVRCKGPNMSLISEGYGQGNARTTPVGVAGLLASVANSANQHPARYPHVLVGLYQANGQRDPASDRPLRQGVPTGPEGLAPQTGARVIAAMEKTHQLYGTAHDACSKVFGATACRAELGVAGKTGTPGDADDRSLHQLIRAQEMHTQCQEQKSKNCDALYPLPRPRYRWYAAVFKSGTSAEYDKAIAVLVHSNWRQSDGRYVDDANAAAEIAFHAIRALRAPARSTP